MKLRIQNDGLDAIATTLRSLLPDNVNDGEVADDVVRKALSELMLTMPDEALYSLCGMAQDFGHPKRDNVVKLSREPQS